MQVIGQVNNIDIINKWDDLPNFIIIQGDIHTGKTYLVKYICEKFGVNYVRMGNSIDDVRLLVSGMVANSHNLYHFKDFDSASIRAKNALLKITEDTPPGNCIVITGSAQIKTLESRARKLVMESYLQEDMIQFMLEYLNKDKVELYYKSGFNTPSKVLLYKDYDKLEDLLNVVNKVSENITYLEPDDVISILNKFDSKYDTVDGAILFLDMLIHNINYKSKYGIANYRFSYKNILKCLVRCKTYLTKSKSLNRRMMIYDTFFQIIKLGGDS